MSGCSGRCGITRERERERETAREAVRARVHRGLPDARERDALSEALSEALPARVAWSAGEDRAAWLYLVASTDDTSWVEARERGAPPPERAEERALRLGFSAAGRFATLQETRFVGAIDAAGLWIEERRLAGVEDPRLGTFVKVAQGVLRRARWAVLDAATLEERLSRDETLWSGLFGGAPMREALGAWIPRDTS